jgi:hypothetical protein
MGTAVPTSAKGAPGHVASWWRSRYGARLLVEIAICGGLLIIYRAIRTFNKTDLGAAFTNARGVVRLEQWLGLPFEDNLQQVLLDQPALIKALNHYYIWFHFPAAIAMLLWLYLWHPLRYAAWRNLMAFVTFSALVIHLVFPLAPPRMFAGFVDTMQKWGPNIYPPNALDGAANQIAAMPSLHFGWALIEALAVIMVLTSRWRWVILIHPILMTLAIIATANHWWIDAAAAAGLVVGGIAAWRVASRWVGDRRWSWTRMRFQTADGIDRLEAHANCADAAAPPPPVERVDG